MAETIKSALFIDYDSIHRSLTAAGREADAMAQRTSGWVVAIESGRLVTTADGTSTRRRFALRRCYADPALLGKNRIAFVAAGFEVIDCPSLEGRERNAAEINLALDVVEALNHPTGYEEFVLLSADTDLTPILQRIHGQERTAIIYANRATPEGYIEAADGIVEEAKLLSLLYADEAPVQARPVAQPAPARPAVEPRPRAATAAAVPDRSDIEALARKVHAATNVPLLSPRTFAELFRHLAAEIAESGYHFQDTAEKVATKLTEAGRNVTRRQVVFVVKGLALKGHVFSTTDSAERLAEVFREQILYLTRNAGLELTEAEQALLPNWVAGRPAVQVTAEAEQPSVSPAEDAAEKVAPKRKPAKAAPAPKASLPKPPVAVAAPAPAPPAAQPAKSIDEIKRSAATRLAVTPPPAPPAAPRQAAPAAKPAPAPQPKPAASPKPAAAKPVAPPPKAPAPPARPKPAAPAEADSQALESSILAAIAQAVDVLVEDSAAAEEAERTTTKEPAAPELSTPEPKPDPVPSDGGDSDDIGDEIQRIIASYSRARQQGEQH